MDLLRPVMLLLGIVLVFLMGFIPVSSAFSSLSRPHSYDVEGYYDKEGQVMDPRKEALLQLLQGARSANLMGYPAENMFDSGMNKRNICLGDPGCKARYIAAVQGQSGAHMLGRRRRDTSKILTNDRR